MRVSPIMWRMSAWIFCSTLATALAVFIVCVKMGPNQWRLTALLWSLFGVNLLLLVRWTYGALRRAGYPASPTIQLAQWRVMAVYAAALIGTIVLTDFIYRWTASRLLEGLLALCFVPLALVFVKWGYALQPAPQPYEAGMLRWAVTMQFVLPVILGANLILQLLPHHYYGAGLEARRDWTIAAYFVLAPIFPINGYFMLQRYFWARALAAPLSPATS